MGKQYRYLKCSIDDEGIALVVINRPEVLNALSTEVFIEIGIAFDDLKENRAARVVILTGEGEKAFAAGSDIVGMQDWTFLKARETAMIIYGCREKSKVSPVR
jgi:enoyl-CoA hydratase